VWHGRSAARATCLRRRRRRGGRGGQGSGTWQMLVTMEVAMARRAHVDFFAAHRWRAGAWQEEAFFLREPQRALRRLYEFDVYEFLWGQDNRGNLIYRGVPAKAFTTSIPLLLRAVSIYRLIYNPLPWHGRYNAVRSAFLMRGAVSATNAVDTGGKLISKEQIWQRARCRSAEHLFFSLIKVLSVFFCVLFLWPCTARRLL